MAFLGEQQNVAFLSWIGRGPSLRARARLVLTLAFAISLAALSIGLWHTSSAADYATRLVEYESFYSKVLHTRYVVEKLKSSLWRFEMQGGIETERDLSIAIENMRVVVVDLIQNTPRDFDWQQSEVVDEVATRISLFIEQALSLTKQGKNRDPQRAAHLARFGISKLSSDIDLLAQQVMPATAARRDHAREVYVQLERDQLLLFLVLMVTGIVFIIFGPTWLIAPLSRLKGVALKIETGRMRDIGVLGKDEISQVTLALKKALLWREELDFKKSAKIFEIRKVLRSVLRPLQQPVLIIDPEQKINYANKAAAELLHTEQHNLEGELLENLVFAPRLIRAIENAGAGDLEEDAIEIEIELPDGLTHKMTAHLSIVRDRLGDISRIVIVLQQGASDG